MATPMAFILPTAAYLRLSRSGQIRWYARDRLIAWATLVFGVIVMVIGTGLSIEQVYTYNIHYNICLYQDMRHP